MNNLICMICYKQAKIMAYGNSYCKDCFLLSPYYMETKAKQSLDEEKKQREKDGK